MSEDGRFLYATHQLTEGEVGAYAVQEDGTLRELNRQSTHGADPCHLEIHPRGEYLLSANYSSGSVVVHPIAEDGSLGEAVQVGQHTASGQRTARPDGPR